MKKIVLTFLGLSVAVGLVAWLFNINQIFGTSMEPTLHDKQTVVSIRNTQTLNRSDIVFYHPYTKDMNGVDKSQLYVGRIVGLPHEQYRVMGGDIYLKTESYYKLNEEYLPQNIKTPDTVPDYWFALNDYQYLVLGDNRTTITNMNSPDHKIAKSQIVGRLFWKF